MCSKRSEIYEKSDINTIKNEKSPPRRRTASRGGFLLRASLSSWRVASRKTRLPTYPANFAPEGVVLAFGLYPLRAVAHPMGTLWECCTVFRNVGLHPCNVGIAMYSERSAPQASV
jgi:hypothetical protein